jgi:hypothetical protein
MALLAANGVLVAIASYFLSAFVREVRELQKEFRDFQLTIHGRVAALEAVRD